MPDNNPLCRERVGCNFRVCGRHLPDERGLPDIRVPGDDNRECILNVRELAQDVSDIVEDMQVLVDLVDHGCEPGHCPLAHDKGIFRFL